MSARRDLNAIVRSDLAYFIERTFRTVAPGEEYLHNWHIDAIAWHLQLCAQGRIRRLIITMPPRHLKSIAVSVGFVAWLLGRDPTRKIIGVSYSADLASKHANDCRAVMTARWYQKAFPGTRLRRDRNSLQEMQTTREGYRLSTSVGGTLTGRGGNLIIMDDPHKADEVLSDVKREYVLNWYRNTLLSRLNNKARDVIILVQQRLHENDLAGHLLEQGGWCHLNLPALAEVEERIAIGEGIFQTRHVGDLLHPERESQQDLDMLKAQLGSYNFAAQYGQSPAPAGGGLVQWKWFKRYSKAPQKGPGDEIVQSWDVATKAEQTNDWSVCTTWLLRGNEYYLLHVTRARLEFPDLKRRIISEAHAYGADLVLIEDKGAGTSLIQDLYSANLSVVPFSPQDDKATRMMAASPLIEAGRVLLPEEVLWLADFHREIVNFPRGRHDDQVDSVSQFLLWAKDRVSLADFPVMIIPSRFAKEREEMRLLAGTHGPRLW